MKVINKLIILFFFVFLSCEKELDYSKNYNFVRFSLVTDNNGFTYEAPSIVPAKNKELYEYTHTSLAPLKIPIALSTLENSSNTDVFYSVETEGNYSDFSFSSINKVTIPAGKFVDTLQINFNSAWQDFNINKIKLKITSVSKPGIKIGYKNEVNKLDELTIKLGSLNQKYGLQSNLYQIQGNINEEILIKVLFSSPINNATQNNFNFISPEFVPVSNCSPSINSFNYSLVQLPYTGNTQIITYKLKILENISGEANLKINLKSGLPNWQVQNIISANVLKLDNSQRIGDVATNWYNITDNLHRTYGQTWYQNTTTNSCDWQNYFALTKPVAVPSGSEFDNGHGFHKYKIGFTTGTSNTTNPFDLRRWYTGSSVNSPGFNITEAIEFFPQNGNSTTQGTIKVIPQTLNIIKSSNSQVFQVPICGNGNYFFDNLNNRWSMYLELVCDETQINGKNNVIKRMYIYSNNNNNSDPPALSVACGLRINL